MFVRLVHPKTFLVKSPRHDRHLRTADPADRAGDWGVCLRQSWQSQMAVVSAIGPGPVHPGGKRRPELVEWSSPPVLPKES